MMTWLTWREGASRWSRAALLVLITCAGMLASACARPQAAYPTKPVTLVVWTSAGSSSDQYGRALASAMEKHLGQSVVVVNKPGGAGLTALKSLKADPADGYTLLANTASLTTVLNGKDAGDVSVDDFEYIARVQIDPNVLAVKGDSPYTSFDELLSAMKSEPGKLKIAGFETGGYHHVAFTKIMNAGGFQATWVPYSGSGDAATAAMGGHVDAVFANPQVIRGGVESNRLRPLVVTGKDRLPNYPGVPTLKDQGIGVEEYQWRGVMARKGIPAPALEKLQSVIQTAVDEPDWKTYMDKSELLNGYQPSEQYRAFVKQDLEETRKILGVLGL